MKHRWQQIAEDEHRCTRCHLERRDILGPYVRGHRRTVHAWRWTAPATGEVFTREGGLTPTCPPSADGVVPREGRA